MQREISSLTGLRGIAAAWVVIYHLHEFDMISGPFAVLLRHGYLAVDVFFILSGFVMALSYRELFGPAASARNYAVFMMRRIARVYPLYLFLTLVAAFLFFVSNWPEFSRLSFLINLAENLLLIEAWGFGWPFDGPSWSISTEFMAYLAFPVLALVTVYARPARALIVAAICLAVLVLVAGVPTPAAYRFPRQGPLDIAWEHTVWPLIRCLAEFTIGLVVFSLAQRPDVRRWCSRAWFEVVVAVPALVLLLLPGTDLLFVALVGPLILLLAVRNGPTTRLFASPVAMELGRLSYAMYLLHGLLKEIRPVGAEHLSAALGPQAADIVATIVFYAVLLACAWLCFRLIENPARRFVRGIERHLFPAEDRALNLSEAAAVESVQRSR